MAVLLATHNGALWLDEQIASIEQQRDVDVAIIASDDCSDDTTRSLLRDRRITVLPTPSRRLGSANRNFLRLVCEADIGNAEFVSLADQDDIWLPDKLARAVECLRRGGCDAYSADVMAFWPNGRELPIVKSQPQRQYDYLFESAGPGCTFVFTTGAYVSLREWVRSRRDVLEEMKVHDWLFYAHGRKLGWHWHIDSHIALRYRQHQRNEVGANHGWVAVKRRCAQLFSGAFRNDALAIARAVEDSSWVSQSLNRLSFLDRLRLLFHWRQLRRRSRDARVLALSLLVMPRKP